MHTLFECCLFTKLGLQLPQVEILVWMATFVNYQSTFDTPQG
jgi:hypothetical protein